MTKIIKYSTFFMSFRIFRLIDFGSGLVPDLHTKSFVCFRREIDLRYTTINWTCSQNPLSLPAELDLRYTTIILFTKSFVASSEGWFEIRNDNFIHKTRCQLWAKVSEKLPKTTENLWKIIENIEESMQHI